MTVQCSPPFHPKILFLESCLIRAYLSNLAKPPQAITVTSNVMIFSVESHIYLLNILLRQVTDSFFILHSIGIPQIQRVWSLLYGCNFYFSQCSAGSVTKVLILCDTFFPLFSNMLRRDSQILTSQSQVRSDSLVSTQTSVLKRLL